ncbi:MAG: CGNR zinc finger domain-containing protein [Desulfobacterales bacterium]|nr:CGNR zinc finger domain-containing protein [Desulfobacterales bacterium]
MKDNNKHAGNLSLLGGRPCLDFVNTLDWRGSGQPIDFLKTYADLVVWSQHAGTLSRKAAGRISRLSASRPSKQNRALKRAIQLRETMYHIFSSLADGKAAPNSDLKTFNQFFSRTMKNSKIVKTPHGYQWNLAEDQADLEWILGPLVRSAADLLISIELQRVKKCGDPACGWLFLDTSRNRSRRWCNMSDCGNRAKASRFYRKKTGKRK